MSINNYSPDVEGVSFSILPTCVLRFQSRNKSTEVPIRALLDNCSQRSFLTAEALANLRYKYLDKEQMKLSGFLSSSAVDMYDVVVLFLPYQEDEIAIPVVVVTHQFHQNEDHVEEMLTKTLKPLRINLNNLCLSDKNVLKPPQLRAPINLLLGIDNYYKVVNPGYTKLKTLVLLPCLSGNVLTGMCSVPNFTTVSATALTLSTSIDLNHYLELDSNDVKSSSLCLESLWSMDHIGIHSKEIGSTDKDVLCRFEKSVRYSAKDKQYIVTLPWRSDPSILPCNFGVAFQRLKWLQKKFISNQEFSKHYTSVIQDQLDRNFIEEVFESSPKMKQCHYLAHHGVFKESRTTPVRVVFDCSAKENNRSPSLNDLLYTGPSLISELAQNLLRFRLDKFAAVRDIEKPS